MLIKMTNMICFRDGSEDDGGWAVGLSAFAVADKGPGGRAYAPGRRLAEISGAKPLRGAWKGCFRLRTGDWRMIVKPAGDILWIVRIDNRRDV